MADLSPGFALITPRTSRSSMSSNINALPPIRRTSEGSARPSPSSASMPSTPSSIPSFRAIRNFLPFGSNKPSSPAQPSTQIKHPFHFASLRRSSDRKASISSIRDRQKDHDDHPVISITRLESEEFGVHKRSYDLVRAASASDSLLPSSTAAQSPTTVQETYTPVYCTADLSTILEADNSGISKHLPSPSPSPPPTFPQTFFPSEDTFLPKMFFTPPSQGMSVSSKDTFPSSTGYSRTSCDPSPRTSNLDLSLSKLSAELHDALSPTTADGWFSAIVVEDADMASAPLSDDGSDDRDTTTGLPKTLTEPDATFDFSALDPDLAELLSPHRASSNGKGDLTTEEAWGDSSANGSSSAPYRFGGSAICPTSDPLLHSASSTHLSRGSHSIDLPSHEQQTTPSFSSTRIPTISPPMTPLPSNAPAPPSSSSRSPRGTVSSPESTLATSPRPSLTVRRPPSYLPRLMRSVTSAPPSTPAGKLGTYVETGTRVQRRQPPSPLSAALVSADALARSSLDAPRMRTSSDNGVPRPSVDTSFTPHPSTDTGSRNATFGSVERHSTPQERASSPNDDSPLSGRATPSAPYMLLPTFTTPMSATSSNTPTITPSTGTTTTLLTTLASSPPAITNTPHDPSHLRRRRHPHLFFNRKRSLSVDEHLTSSAHVERPGSSANGQGAGRFGPGMRNGDQTSGARRAEDGETWRAGGRGENRLVSSPLTRNTLTPLTRGPGPPAMEWLGPRTAKAFAAAGLFDGERDGSGARFGRERVGSVSQFEHERDGASSVLSRPDCEREGAMSVMSRSDRDRGSSIGRFERDREPSTSTIHRYASLRDHAPSRAAFSEAASTSSLGTRSTAGGAGAGWSPTFSSTPRTAFSGSTAPTSISSGVGSGIGTGAAAATAAMGVNCTSPNVALRTLQEKHSLETSALLGALADSQETCRKLKDENGVLRERLRKLEAMVNQDGDDTGLGKGGPDEEDVFDKTHSYDQDFDLFPHQHLTSLRVSPAPQARTLTPVPCRPHIQRSHSHLHAKHHSVTAKTSFDFAFRRSPSPSRFSKSRDPSPQKGQPQSSLSIQPPPSPHRSHIQKQRRASTTSSLFPAPPPEMSMLMLEDVGLCTAVSESPPSPGVPSTGNKKLGHKRSYSHSMIPHSHSFYVAQSSYANRSGTFASFASTGMVASSPSTATFSMTEVPGSPHSLQLRPEHELHLGDMTSLSLYAMSDGDVEEGEDEWKDGV